MLLLLLLFLKLQQSLIAAIYSYLFWLSFQMNSESLSSGGVSHGREARLQVQRHY